MKRIGLIVLAAILLIAGLFVGLAMAGPPTTPDIDGTISADGTDWDADELIVDDPLDDSPWGAGNELDNLYATWDENNLYVGISYTISSNAMIIYVDTGVDGGETDFNSGRGWAGAYPRNITFTADSDVDLMLARWDINAPQVYTVTDDIGSADLAASVSVSYTNNMVEFGIPWDVVYTSSIPYSATLHIAAVIAGGDNYGACDSMPDNPSTDGDPGPDAITATYSLDLFAGQDTVVINEVRIDQSGTDNDEYFELAGPAGTFLDGLTYLVIGDGAGGSGVIEQVTDLSGNLIPASGYFVAAESTFGLGTADLTTTLNFENGDNVTHLLVRGFTGSYGDDLDTDDDGDLDVTPWAEVVDLIALIEEENPPSGTEYHYGPPTVGPDGSFVPGHVYRCSALWGIGGFTAGTDDTPGTANVCLPDLAIDKDGPALTVPSSFIAYTIAYDNSGVDYAHDVVISDTLPAGVSYVSDDSGLSCPACSVGATGAFTWYVDTIAPADDFIFTLTAWVTESVPLYSTITNSVSITATGTEIATGNNSDEWETFITSLDLVLDKEGPAYVVAGGDVVYTITLSNVGVVSATNVVVSDALPISTTYVADNADQLGWTCPSCVPGASGVITWTAGDVQSGTLDLSFNLTVAVDAAVANGTALVNAVEVSTETPGDIPDNNTALVETTVYALLPIGEARQLPAGQAAILAGRATMYTGGFYAGGGNTKFYIQDDSGGIAVQCFGSNGTLPDVTLGDLVTVTGEIAIYRNEVRIVPTDNVNDVTVTDGDPSDVPAPLIKLISEVDDDDDALGWLVNLQGEATRVDEYSYSYEVDLSDGMGNTALIYVDKNTGIDMSGVSVGASYVITGIAEIYDSTYEVKPRIQADILEFTPQTLQLRKYGPDFVLQSQLYTYTLIATNNTAFPLTNVVITDAIPAANAALAYIGDGGVQVGNTISWTDASLVAGAQWQVHFAMTSTGAVGSHIVNDDFAAWASNWITRETGPGVDTEITDGCTPGYVPIYDVQGITDTTPYAGQAVDTCGVVVGVSGSLRGVFIQDPAGDSDDATSDGVFVYRGYQGVAGVTLGDLVEVSGEAEERYGVTQIDAAGSSDVLDVVANQQPLPVVAHLDPPPDRIDADAYLEAREGMLADVPLEANVVGPTNAYGELYVVRSDSGLTRLVLQTDPPDGYRIGIDDGIVASGEFKVGDVVDGVYGPLHYTYDNWKVEQLQLLTSVSSPALPDFPSYAPAAVDQFTVGAFNLLNLDGDDDAIKLDKIVNSIDAMGGPLVLGLSEIAVEDCWHIDNYTVTGVIDDLLAGLTAEGYNYDYVASHPDVGCHGVALLYDTDRVTADDWTTLQGCSASGSSNTDYDPLWDTCQALGEYPLFSRRPVVFTGTVESSTTVTQVVVIANHFKSKGGSSTCTEPDCLDRRLAQAELVATYAVDLMDNGLPNVAVVGDLNDFVDSAPLNALYVTGTLTNTFYSLLPEERYSYIYNGTSQVLDHVLLSPALWAALLDFVPLHINADYPAAWELDDTVAYGASDHDPVLAYVGRRMLYLPVVFKD